MKQKEIQEILDADPLAEFAISPDLNTTGLLAVTIIRGLSKRSPGLWNYTSTRELIKRSTGSWHYTGRCDQCSTIRSAEIILPEKASELVEDAISTRQVQYTNVSRATLA